MEKFKININNKFNFKDPESSEKYKKLREKVFKTIKKYKLINKNDKVLLALSGGKDSSVLALILRDFFKRNKINLEENLLAIHVDVGIKLNNLQKERAKALCAHFGIPFQIIKAPINIDALYKERKSNVCNVCGIQRRHIYTDVALNKGFNVIATGHDMDDEAETFLMNVLQNNWKAASNNYIYKKSEKLPKKIKPLIFVSNEETKEVAIELNIIENKKSGKLCLCDCPYSPQSFRYHVRKFLDSVKKEWDSSVLNKIVNFSLKFHENVDKNEKKEKLERCEICGTLSFNRICKLCSIKKELEDLK